MPSSQQRQSRLDTYFDATISGGRARFRAIPHLDRRNLCSPEILFPPAPRISPPTILLYPVRLPLQPRVIPDGDVFPLTALGKERIFIPASESVRVERNRKEVSPGLSEARHAPTSRQQPLYAGSIEPRIHCAPSVSAVLSQSTATRRTAIHHLPGDGFGATGVDACINSASHLGGNGPSPARLVAFGRSPLAPKRSPAPAVSSRPSSTRAVVRPRHQRLLISHVAGHFEPIIVAASSLMSTKCGGTYRTKRAEPVACPAQRKCEPVQPLRQERLIKPARTACRVPPRNPAQLVAPREFGCERPLVFITRALPEPPDRKR